MVEVDVYSVFYKCLKIKSKLKLAAFLSYTIETKYFSERVTSTSFRSKKPSSGQSYTNLRLLKQGPKDGGHAEDAGCSCSFVTQSYNSVHKFGCCASAYLEATDSRICQKRIRRAHPT